MENLSIVKSETIWIDEECPGNILPLKEENCKQEEIPASLDHAESTEQGTEENTCTSEEMQFAFVNCDEGWDIEVHETGVVDDKEDIISEDENSSTSPSERSARLPSSGFKTQSEEIIPHTCTRIGETYYCIPCDTPFHTQSDLNTHISKTHKRKTCFQCPKCEKSYRFESKLFEHFVVHTKLRPFYCKHCAQQFSRLADVKKHMFLYHNSTADTDIIRIDLRNYHSLGEKGSIPPIIPYQQKAELISKQNLHICNQCSEIFTSKGELISHLTTVHDLRRSTYQCPMCQNSFSNAYELLEHMDLHSSTWKHDCNKCKRTFSHRTMLIQHMKEHAAKNTADTSNVMPVRKIVKGDYPCKYCGKIFSWPSKLGEHMATHTKEVLFKCDICVKGFSTRTGFVYHMARHNNTGLHPCPNCEKKFCRKSELSKHLQTH